MATTTTTTVTVLTKARDEARQHVATAMPDNQSKMKAGDALVKNLNNTEFKKQAYDSARFLARTIYNIRTGFMVVAGTLVSFDAKNFKDKDGNVLSLGREWSLLFKEFNTTLQFSLDQVTDAVVMMKSVTAALGDVTENDGIDLALKLNHFMKRLEVEEASALETKMKFQTLADNVILFNAKVDVALDKAAEAKIKTDLDSARTRLADLTKELEVCNQRLNVGAKEIISAVAVGASHAAMAVFTLDFFGMSGPWNSVAGGIAHEHAKKKAECEHNITLINQEINDLLARDSGLGTFRTTLAESTKVAASVASISSQILSIVDIWKTINLDLHSLDQALSAQLKDNPVITKCFLAKLSVAKEIYGHLILLLETYVEQTNAANSK
ncbi:hypothetical protein MVEN_02334600 [Mycena venus]|uniref:Uncharacterized protein n=1 Tax=Mycena venus TaxID=2733690 RepID=A0A8H7CFQ0_9AGAR|nr:hypothetical protein MVEN_02334600 [Mycena venus]